MNLYEKISNVIENYNMDTDKDNYDLEEYFDLIESNAHELYPNNKVYIYDYDTGNDTYELDSQLDDLLSLAKAHKIIDFCNCYDDETIITVIITDETKGA